MSVHLLCGPDGPQPPYLRLAWPGTGVGWHAPGPLFVSRMTSAPAFDPTSLPAGEHVCERSASALPLICAALLSSDPFLPCKGNS